MPEVSKRFCDKEDLQFYEFLIERCEQLRFSEARDGVTKPPTKRMRRVTLTAKFGSKVLKMLRQIEAAGPGAPAGWGLLEQLIYLRDRVAKEESVDD